MMGYSHPAPCPAQQLKAPQINSWQIQFENTDHLFWKQSIFLEIIFQFHLSGLGSCAGVGPNKCSDPAEVLIDLISQPHLLCCPPSHTRATKYSISTEDLTPEGSVDINRSIRKYSEEKCRICSHDMVNDTLTHALMARQLRSVHKNIPKKEHCWPVASGPVLPDQSLRFHLPFSDFIWGFYWLESLGNASH